MTVILMTVVYILGIGIISMIGKLMGKKFLAPHNNISTWRKHNPSASPATMY